MHTPASTAAGIGSQCPFGAPLTVGRAACTQAQEVVRRGGAEYDCSSDPALARCRQLHARLKQAGLAAFDATDDLTQVPHSVLVKIATGGLAGLAELLGEAAAPIADVERLVAAAEQQFDGIEQIPTAPLTQAMLRCQLERRRRR
ncbi:MAG: hypothetical protein EA400_03865 [Chromatiaceae bacterium]|nr:MAG: hypothetical protein EA400_03865 [Chromatiaceae bacterium]